MGYIFEYIYLFMLCAKLSKLKALSERVRAESRAIYVEVRRSYEFKALFTPSVTIYTDMHGDISAC